MTKCFLLLGQAPGPDVADRIAHMFASCPYVYFVSAFGNFVVGIFALPEERRWWLRGIADDPEGSLGLVQAAVYETDHPAYPPHVDPRSVEDADELSPCGADCRLCPRLGDDCAGCPGSSRFRQS